MKNIIIIILPIAILALFTIFGLSIQTSAVSTTACLENGMLQTETQKANLNNKQTTIEQRCKILYVINNDALMCMQSVDEKNPLFAIIRNFTIVSDKTIIDRHNNLCGNTDWKIN